MDTVTNLPDESLRRGETRFFLVGGRDRSTEERRPFLGALREPDRSLRYKFTLER